MPRGQELIIVLVVVVLLFGARKLPELARSLGASAKEFRKGIEEGAADDTTAESTETPQNN
ncbi:MAG: twin-arginine translocase TatA/TatE family subunit [Acidimicrobiia bacterium]|jgi:sec-independent protein translocase protein TatA|nr:twin-arginine translocase TatA/TatE family subunit [Acidimicrobiia bacterium]